MESWSPYHRAFERLTAMSDSDIEEYVYRRLSGREADPPYESSRNQEGPEAFLVWAFGDGTTAPAAGLARGASSLLSRHFPLFVAGHKTEARLLSRLLYLAVRFHAWDAAKPIQNALVAKGVLNETNAELLRKARDVPHAGTLLHQALVALGYLSTGLRAGDAQAQVAFWAPIVRGEAAHESGMRLIALKALALRNWKQAIERYLAHYIRELLDALDGGRPRHLVVQDLANVLSFFTYQSRLQTKPSIAGPDPNLLEDPTPLSVAFGCFAREERAARPLALLEDALNLLRSDPRLFGDDSLWRQWNSGKYILFTVEEACTPCPDVRRRLAVDGIPPSANPFSYARQLAGAFAV